MEPSLRPSASAIPVARPVAEPAPSGVKGTGRRWETPPAGSPVRLRLDLQRRARSNLRRHVVRAATRFVVLVLADLLSFYLMRAVVRGVRDHAALGEWVAGVMGSVLPAGILNGWQFASALFASLVLLGCYGAGDQRRDPRRLFMAAALATALPLWMAIWIRGPSVVAVEFGLTTVLVWAGLMADRFGVEWVVARVRSPEQTAARTLFVGTSSECAAVAGMPAFQSRGDFLPLGFVDTQPSPAPGALGQLAQLPRVLGECGAETVVLCGALSNGQLADVTNTALTAGCQLLTLPCGGAVPGVQPGIVWRRGQPLMELTAPTLKGWQLVVKRVIDVIGSALGLVVLSPVLAFVALRIKLDSPGPVLFRQERVGREGRRFEILKFRTMTCDAEEHRDELLERSIYADRRLFKVPDDPRITKLGRWLRRSSLDELPQLVNVLRGEMSLVGPRPPLPSEVELYQAHHYARFDVKPGMTGPWQVSGRNQITDFEQVVDIESDYIRNWSLFSDVILLLRTLPAVLSSRGAH